ncbi:MAG: helix-turn-helix transcriptional regulator [Actinophytocola sp.]|uniref:helix-turn-helix domain-containing protein n=1 Tax=Actinophytocola sp. TaxID=1872138 RepID=UPI003C738FDA
MDDMDDLSPGSLVRRWRLGKHLRDLRAAAGKSQEEAGAYAGIRAATISRIENGKHAILAKNVRALCQLYDVGAPLVDTLVRQAEESNERGWWLSYSDTMPDWFATWVGFEADAEEIRVYQSEMVPGLLQTADYTRALRASYGPGATEDELAKSVAFRLERQKRFAARPPIYRVVLNEAVIRRPIGEMHTQLQHLADLSLRDNITLQILPFEVGPHAAMKGAFSLLTLPGEPAPNFVYLEHDDGAVYLERPSDLARYTRTFDSLTRHALSPGDSRALLASLVNA